MSTRSYNPIHPAKQIVVYDFAAGQPIAPSNEVVIVVHGAPQADPGEHVAADCGVMGVADNPATKQPGNWVREGIASGVEVESWSELRQRLP